jgi:hypothetical protein
MDCPNCGEILIADQYDKRQEWEDIYYHCENCAKYFCRTITRETQSSLIENDEIVEVD